MRKTITILIGLLVLGGGAFMYLTRPVTIDPVATDTASATAPTSVASASPTTAETYNIVSAKSSAEFTIDEVLRGSPFTVHGTSSAVSGTASLSESAGKTVLTLGTISIDARTFKTDSTQRDGAIARLILKSTEPGNEMIPFVASGPVTLPESPRDGSTYPFSVTGTLTISGKSHTETFIGTITKSGSTLTTKVTAPVKRSSYGLVIPNIPFVANVPDTFTLSAVIVASK